MKEEMYNFVDNAYKKKCEEMNLNELDWHDGELFSYWDVLKLFKDFDKSQEKNNGTM